ncbi:hypothetical protein V2J09_020824, partial [Rumex salicifolius]
DNHLLLALFLLSHSQCRLQLHQQLRRLHKLTRSHKLPRLLQIVREERKKRVELGGDGSRVGDGVGGKGEKLGEVGLMGEDVIADLGLDLFGVSIETVDEEAEIGSGEGRRVVEIVCRKQVPNVNGFEQHIHSQLNLGYDGGEEILDNNRWSGGDADGGIGRRLLQRVVSSPAPVLYAQGLLRSFKGGRTTLFSNVLKRNLSVSSSNVIDAATKDGELRVFIVAGEVSGDNIAARLMGSLKKISPLPIRFSGVGGSMMTQQGLKSLFPMEDIAVMGIWELLPHMYKIRARLKETVDSACLFKPHVVITVDAKGFSFRLLKQLRAKCLCSPLDLPRHFHYVAPSFWAWKGGEERLKGLSQFVDHIFCILPFEEDVCRSNGLEATFVGHPVVEDVVNLNLRKNLHNMKVKGSNEDFRSTPIVSVLPGSRLQVVTRMLPIFSDTMHLLKAKISDVQTVMHVAPNKNVESYISSMTHQWPVPLVTVPGSSTQLKYDSFSASRAALCTSGTAAVELQLAQLPSVVAYRAHILTEWLILYKAKVPYISLPNIMLDSPVIPEHLFQDCTPTRLASTLVELIRDEGVREQQIDSSNDVLRLLSPSTSRLVDYDFEEEATPSMIAASTLLYSHFKPSV